ncbi:hypothetical protein ACTU6U_01705 [Microbacterium sp. A196]|uniref:hypothetical protein n=1 Tax=Microbacterium sp. A196 TaxID=3457320 RepID=UPI003FCF69C5
MAEDAGRFPGAHGWSNSVRRGFVFWALTYGLAWVVITAGRGPEPPAPECEI